jgi:hypothetical protein
VKFLSRAGASGSRDLPWALPRVLQVTPKIKSRGGSVWRAGRGPGGVCLKAAGSAFDPIRRQRYCSERCREAARKWSRWKAQQRYRATTAGKERRNGQSLRYRERVRSRKPAESEAVDEPARVITNEEFFRSFVRPARLLRELRAPAAKSLTALLFAGMPAGAGARARARAALERSARLQAGQHRARYFAVCFMQITSAGLTQQSALGYPCSAALRYQRPASAPFGALS